MGVSGCPFKYDFKVWGGLATKSWIKSLWERIHRFNIKIDLDYDAFPMPRERDECIMERFVREKVAGKELASINRVRKHQQALFLSDIVSANGRTIEEVYLSDWQLSYERQLGRRRSHLDFGKEFPSNDDFVNWNRALNSSTLGTMTLPNRLGNWVAASPRIWRVFYDEVEKSHKKLLLI